MICNILEYPKSINRGKRSHSFHRDFTEKRMIITFQKEKFFASSFCSQNQFASPKYYLSCFWERLSPDETDICKNIQKQMCRANGVKTNHGYTHSNNKAEREKKPLSSSKRSWLSRLLLDSQ